MGKVVQRLANHYSVNAGGSQRQFMSVRYQLRGGTGGEGEHPRHPVHYHVLQIGLLNQHPVSELARTAAQVQHPRSGGNPSNQSASNAHAQLGYAFSSRRANNQPTLSDAASHQKLQTLLPETRYLRLETAADLQL